MPSLTYLIHIMMENVTTRHLLSLLRFAVPEYLKKHQIPVSPKTRGFERSSGGGCADGGGGSGALLQESVH